VSVKAVAVLGAVSLLSCGPGRTSDENLENVFLYHSAELASLGAMAQQDGYMVGDSYVNTGNFIFFVRDGKFTETRVPPPITIERLNQYQDLLKSTGLGGAVYASDGLSVYFQFDGPSLATGDAHKGFYYSPQPPPLTTSLDGIRKPPSAGRQRYFLYKSLPKQGWFLYLCIN
jgi:hypothetical protein